MSAAHSTPAPARNVATTTIERPAAVEFEYVGRTALTVLGPFTGMKYRFDHTGARLRIDGRDADSLAAIPALRRAV
jgi:hypothetical protein